MHLSAEVHSSHARAAGGLVFGGAVLVVACTSLTGADDLRIEEGEGTGASSSSGSHPGPDGAVSGSEAGSDDGGVDPPLPQCAAGVCVPTTDGWSPATWPGLFGGGACPDGWPTKTAYKIAAAFACDCACTPNEGSCEGPLSIAVGSGFTCTAAPTALPAFPGDGGCVEAQIDVSVASPVRVTAAPVSPPTACTGAPKPIGGGAETVPLCSGATATPSAQCAPTESCVPTPGRGNEMCIVHDGLVPCPQGFGRRLEVTTAGVKDTRTCSSSCTCDPGCDSGHLDAFFDSRCTTTVGSAKLGDCAIANLGQGVSFRYFAGNGCEPAQRPTVQGAVMLETPKTVCCARAGF